MHAAGRYLDPRASLIVRAPVPTIPKGLDTAPSIEPMTASGPDEAAERRAAIKGTAGSADDIFEPGYLERLRQDWPT